MRKRFASGCLVAVALLTGCAEKGSHAESSPSAATPPAPSFKIVGSNKQVMQAITIPSSEVIFGIADAPPQSDEQWLAVENAAVALAESGNLLLLPERLVDTQEWAGYAHELIDKASAALHAARAKSVDQVLASGDALYRVCENCHKKYMPQN